MPTDPKDIDLSPLIGPWMNGFSSSHMAVSYMHMSPNLDTASKRAVRAAPERLLAGMALAARSGIRPQGYPMPFSPPAFCLGLPFATLEKKKPCWAGINMYGT